MTAASRIATMVAAIFVVCPQAGENPRLLRVAARPSREFIVWNVGQGSWATLSTPDACWHFDMGGERADWPAIASECAGKLNRVSFSHWDLDHISFAREAAQRLPGLCVADRPQGEASLAKARALANLPDCAPAIDRKIDALELTRVGDRPFRARVGRGARRRSSSFAKVERSSNEESRVYVSASTVVLPGDSPKNCEAVWARRLPPNNRATILALGHHGSRTSTGPELLSKLPRLQTAVASARYARYGHPHAEVAARLKHRGVALLRTEIWGHLRFALPEAGSHRKEVDQ